MLTMRYLKGAYQLSRSSVQVTVSSGGSGATLFSVTIPANLMTANSQIVVKADVSSSGTVGARTLTLSLNDGSGAATITAGTMSSTSCRFETRVCNRNSRTSQRSSVDGAINLSLTTAFATSTKDTGVDCTLNLSITNPSDSVTLESYAVEVWP